MNTYFPEVIEHVQEVLNLGLDKEKYIQNVLMPFVIPNEVIDLIHQYEYSIEMLIDNNQSIGKYLKINCERYSNRNYRIDYKIHIVFSTLCKAYYQKHCYEIPDLNPDSSQLDGIFVGDDVKPLTEKQISFFYYLNEILKKQYSYTHYYLVALDSQLPDIKIINPKLEEKYHTNRATPYMIMYEDFWGYLEELNKDLDIKNN